MKTHAIAIEPGFDFAGGLLCLDFVNTFGGLPLDSVSQERLASYSRLVAWSCQAGLMSESEANLLLKDPDTTSGETAAILERALILREALYRVLMAVIQDRLPAASDLDVLNQEVERGMAGAQVRATPEGFGWVWHKEEKSYDHMLGTVARSAAILLTSAERKQVRKCANEECRWLYVDTTKNHSRQWCNSASCGNRARVRRHRERQHSMENTGIPDE